ncbi:autophagy protein 12-like isoform X1 [Cataglyphis hispanica]|uniref:autophagy protein 12-like isoform X1 n=1 Tax=Cataglyphis hispanica TaxID=1086592 RepID=UPI0021807AB8|nr:autophagy protein 12-like isoform X1 [Cataglyphis hispanica]XP_050445090.1 autophagy protein 12-like isoform X1 [Cataglyphis hispanica]XP_050445091.1 autophagy protein 12-like isoform X1 [Cataglyphis hispanica]
MAAKEEVNNVTTETKIEETPDSTTEDAPASLETIPEGNAVRNGLQTAQKDKTKIDILLKATANAPIMKQKKWSVCQDNPIGRISEFIKKYLKLDPNERLFLYVNQTFAPAPDQTVKNLYDCYGADGKLVIHYCKSQAWG